MRKLRSLSAVVPLALLAALLLTAVDAKRVSLVLCERILFCFETLIPSLFGCMALAEMLTASGAGAWFGRWLRLPHFPPAAAGIFAVSQIAGYPVGTILLQRAVGEGVLSRDDAARLTGVCFGGGPAFLVGLAGAQLFGSAAAGWCMLGACIAANIASACILHPRETLRGSTEQANCRLTAQMVTGAVSSAMRSLAQICGMVLLFAVVLLLGEKTGLTALTAHLIGLFGVPQQTARALLTAFCDVTQLPALFRCGLSFSTLLPVTAFLLSFGGICVHCQCLAAGRGLVSLPRLLVTRLLAALLAALLTAVLAPLIPLPETASVFAPNTAWSQTQSVLPGFLIFCVGFPFFIKKDWTNQK